MLKGQNTSIPLEVYFLLLGESFSWKTSFLEKLLYNNFSLSVYHTLGFYSDYLLNMDVKGEKFLIRFIDTPGNINSLIVSERLFEYADAVIFFYEITCINEIFDYLEKKSKQ